MIKKILIPYATYGNGHKVVANYIKERFEKKNPDIEIETLDILDYATPFMRKVSKGLFEKTMFAKNPIIWELIYRFYNHKFRSLGMRKLCYHLFDNAKMRSKIEEYNPDIIISTHFFASILASKYLKNNLIQSKLYTVITDYEVHEVWTKSFKYEEAIIVSNKEMSKEDLLKYYEMLVDKYPIISIEDPFEENDLTSFAKLTSLLGNKIMVIGDDAFVTNPKYLKEGIELNAGNAILIKANQIGTVTEMTKTVLMAKKGNFKTMISHRSGETLDTFIADFAVGLSIPFIKTGSMSRGERIAKYNRLMEIEDKLSKKS